MSTRKPRTVKTNIRPEELIMDERGVKDARYYCLPPFHGDPSHISTRGRYRYHLVSQGHVVGTFTNCASAAQFVNTSPRKISRRKEEPGCNAGTSAIKREGTPGRSAGESSQLLADLKRYCAPIRTPPPSPCKAGPSLPPSPLKGGRRSPTEDSDDSGETRFVNFAIRGSGIMSGSVDRSQHRYREMQRRGEEPDMLVTRSLAQASRFALEEDE
ncbi:hypothetical protein B0H14DRAFT_3506409 [Mycena olivaceomarginata]|nr:hypothetical protein B0H14DRAFT_3506409 [Mycena olivaceomarginata]